nr:MAG TPA: hypothetical protein [Siphoviridae sp. ct8TV20]
MFIKNPPKYYKGGNAIRSLSSCTSKKHFSITRD